MKRQDYEQLTLFPEDSPASHSPLPGSEVARMMTVTSGLKCLESYGNSGPLGSLVRMCLGSSIWHSTRCLLTWKTKATKLNHLLFRLAVSMPRTSESESLFWPTPTTGSSLCAGTGSFQMLQRMKDRGLITEEERRNLSQGNGGKTNPALLEWMMGYDQAFTKMLPTPLSSMWKGGCQKRYPRGGYYDNNLQSLIESTPLGRIGPTNPEWVEWLMGYPIGWTELNPLETQ